MIVPAHISVVVGATAVAEHSPVTSANVGTTGAVTSSTITFCVCVATFPLPSSKLQVIVKFPCVL